MLSSDLISPGKLATLLGVHYVTLWRMTASDARLEHCSFRIGKKKRKYSLRLLREAGILREDANA
jgi:hypothetical protein